MQANAALKIETEKNNAVNINDQNPLSGFNETLLSSLPYPAMYIRRKDRVVLAVNKIAAELGVKPGGYCWREFQKEENISEEEKKIAALYPDVVPSQFNIKCAFCRSDQCFSEVAGQNIPELHAFGQIWNTYWIKVSDDIFLHYAVNITEDNQIERINYARLHLFDFAENHPLDELLEETLNQAETITGSLIGFFHFVEEDQKNLTLQNWSTRTKKDYCRAEGKGMNYEITLAGVWVDCIRERHAVIHNDYSSLEHKKGLPPGHAAVIREMVVPVIRGSKIMAIVGVGNKPTNYNEKDLEVVTLFADLAWDIAERKKAELEIKLKNDELQKINAEKDKFFSIIAHDLRGPFSGFMGLTDLLAEGCANMTSDEIQKIGELLRGSASNLFGLLENLLSWSRMQRGIMPFEPVSQVLKSKVEEGMALVIEGALKKEITIGYDISDELIAFADSNMLLAIIRNLAFNAVKFTPRGGNITISAKERANHLVEISVKDTGIGMDQFKIDNLFRLDINSSRKGTEGEISTGLGLILCKDFVEKHGGKLWVESIENIGSTFYFTLPAKE
ncbi:MAG: GAF domain-containing sensor histidine kinase [Mariniphaga sp.]